MMPAQRCRGFVIVCSFLLQGAMALRLPARANVQLPESEVPHDTVIVEVPPDTGIVDLHTKCGSSPKILSDYLRSRQIHWKSSNYVEKGGVWQNLVNNKLLGYSFANKLGVATPNLLSCTTDLKDLPLSWPADWPMKFVIKPVNGFNSEGVILVERRVDVATHVWTSVDMVNGGFMRGQEDVQHRYKGGNFMQRDGKNTTKSKVLLIIEELLEYNDGDGVVSTVDKRPRKVEAIADDLPAMALAQQIKEEPTDSEVEAIADGLPGQQIPTEDEAIADGLPAISLESAAPQIAGYSYVHFPAPPDFKFFMFDDEIGAVVIMVGRGTPSNCSFWVDGDFKFLTKLLPSPEAEERMAIEKAAKAIEKAAQKEASAALKEEKAAVKAAQKAAQKDASRKLNQVSLLELKKRDLIKKAQAQYESMYGYVPCEHKQVNKPESWNALASTAKLLGGALGVHFRVDLFSTNRGVVLGEFTPWSGNGKNDTLSPQVDAHLGQRWQAHGCEEGGLVNKTNEPFFNELHSYEGRCSNSNVALKCFRDAFDEVHGDNLGSLCRLAKNIKALDNHESDKEFATLTNAGIQKTDKPVVHQVLPVVEVIAATEVPENRRKSRRR